MARTIYDKPTRALLKDMLKDMGLKPGQVFTNSRAIEWFKQRYPKLWLFDSVCRRGLATQYAMRETGRAGVSLALSPKRVSP